MMNPVISILHLHSGFQLLEIVLKLIKWYAATKIVQEIQHKVLRIYTILFTFPAEITLATASEEQKSVSFNQKPLLNWEQPSQTTTSIQFFSAWLVDMESRIFCGF